MTKNVFVMGLNEPNRTLLNTLHNAGGYRFHSLLKAEELEEPREYRVKALLQHARDELRGFSGAIDAVVGYIDMPVGFMVPILCREFDLPSPSLESVLRCQHKYWSRVEQSKAIPENIPRFNLVNPFADHPFSQIELEFPFWIKPVKSAGSYLGYRIHNRRQFEQKIAVIRNHILRLAEPFEYFLDYAQLPPHMSGIDFSYCIAEEIIPGRQCTLEGYVYDGKTHVYGVVDSIRHGNRTTFARYQYPSRLPQDIQARMINIVTRIIRHIGLDNSPFNIEFFWSRNHDRIRLLEINTRISQSHSHLFWRVDGTSNHGIMVDIGLGQHPVFPFRCGDFRCAAKFFYRKFSDATVLSVPTQQQIDQIEQRIPGTRITVNVRQGMKLRHLLEQDSYSYDIAWIFVAGDNQRQLLSRYEQCVNALDFEFGD